jgi:hypothetical protein
MGLQLCKVQIVEYSQRANLSRENRWNVNLSLEVNSAFVTTRSNFKAFFITRLFN